MAPSQLRQGRSSHSPSTRHRGEIDLVQALRGLSFGSPPAATAPVLPYGADATPGEVLLVAAGSGAGAEILLALLRLVA